MSIQLKKLSWFDSSTLNEYWGQMVTFGSVDPTIDGNTESSARYNHNHRLANIVEDANHVTINQANKTKLEGLKTWAETQSWVGSEISRVILAVEWRDAVNVYSDLAKIANPKDGWMVPVLNDEGAVGANYKQSGDYRYHDNTTHVTGQPTGWYLTNSTKVPLASATLNGLLSKEGFTKLDTFVSFPGFGTIAGKAAQGNHTHDGSYLKPSDVAEWAKQPTKPSYSFSEIKTPPTTLSGYGITDAIGNQGGKIKSGNSSDSYHLEFGVGNYVGSTSNGVVLQNTAQGSNSIFRVANDNELYHTKGGMVEKKVWTGHNFDPSIKVDNTDARLTNARPAADVYAWAKAATKPEYSFSEIKTPPTTLSGYGITDAINNQGNTIITGVVGSVGRFLKIGISVIGINNDYLFWENGTGNGIKQKISTGELIHTIESINKPIWTGHNFDPTSKLNTSDISNWAKAATKPEYSFSEIKTPPTTLSGYGITDAVTNTDARLINARPASDVYAWAKQQAKPGYIFNEIGDATQTSVPVGMVIRRIIAHTIKNGNGYISRAAIGLTNPESKFSPVILSVGTNDGGTTWTDFTFDTNGRLTSPAGTFALTSELPTLASLGAIPTTASCNKNWNWTGHSGQPPWVWGGTNGTDMFVYNPANFTVERATFANSCDADLQMGNYWIRNVKDIAFSSDIRLKTNLREVDSNIIKNVLDITPYEYEFKKELGKRRIGYIAQEVQEMFPNMVLETLNKENDEKELSFSYRELMILKIEALAKEIKSLKNEINNLKQK